MRPAIEFLKRAAKTFAGKGLTVRQLVVLMHLADVRATTGTHEGVKLRELAAVTEINKPALVRATIELSARGMVMRRRGQRDGRDCFITITAKGVDFLSTAAGADIAPAPARGM
jgi:DNA-binding MarR family transcriptional regulator